jgi:hypothetical protein
MTQLKPSGNLLKNVQEIGKIKFGVKVVKKTKSSFERQIQESVFREQERQHSLLNSRAEYNLCAVPRLTTKIGDSNYNKWEEKTEKEREKEDKLEEKIRKMRKERNKTKRNPKNLKEPAGKRQTVDAEEYRERREEWGRPKDCERGEKRDRMPESSETERSEPMRKKMKHATIKFTTKTDQPTERSTERHRYEEFVEQDPCELLDCERKMQQHRDEMREEEKYRDQKKERASNLEKSWELRRMCIQYIRENNKNWKDEETEKKKRHENLERKKERLIKMGVPPD